MAGFLATVFNHVAVTFLADPNQTEVILEVNERVRVSKSGGFGGRWHPRTDVRMFACLAAGVGRRAASRPSRPAIPALSR